MFHIQKPIFSLLFLFYICSKFGGKCLSEDEQHLKISLEANSPGNCPDIKCPIGQNGKPCSNNGTCTCAGQCICNAGRVGESCQKEFGKMTCTILRYCVQCRVYGSGPFAEEANDCETYCKEYPQPIVVEKFSTNEDRGEEAEVICSFIDSSNSTSCRFYFKLELLDYMDKSASSGTTNILRSRVASIGQAPSHYFRIIVQKEQECPGNGTAVDEMTLGSQEQLTNGNHPAGYTTVFIVLMFISLPFLACFVSCLHNFKKLPCGLCNMFRIPSARYLRNVRTYPGVIDEDFEITFRA